MNKPFFIILSCIIALLGITVAVYAQGGTPFGGRITSVIHCECNNVYWLDIDNVARQQSPRKFIYDPASTILYQFKQIRRPGPQTLGLWSGEKPCIRPVCSHGSCCPIGTGKSIKMVGTSR